MTTSTLETTAVKVIPFNSVKALSDSLDINEKLFFVKTSHGRLLGEARVTKNQHGVCYSIQANQTLFGCGQKKAGTHGFGLLNCDQGTCQGQTRNFSNDLSGLEERILSGFSNRANFRSCHLPAKCRLMAYISETPVVHHLLEQAHINFEELSKNINTIQPSPACHRKLKQTYQAILDGEPGQTCCAGISPQKQADVYRAIADCFITAHISEHIPIKLTHRHELCKDLIIWGHVHVEEAHTLERVLAELHTTRASLSQGCKEVLGIGPMEVLRSIRLEHVYQALNNQQIRRKLGCSKIEDIREHYGFNSRGNFAALYKSYFDESPRETLKRST